MAFTQLDIYNKALYLLGERALATIDEAREPRYVLDAIYNLDAVNQCLELAKPAFARKTVKLTGGTAGTTHDFASVYDLPSDYVTMVGAYSDAHLSQRVEDYIVEGLTIASDYDPLYVRYISSGYTMSDWNPAFANLVAAYLAMESATRLDGEEQDRLTAVFQGRLKFSIELDADEEPRKRSNPTSFTLNSDWLKIYNDALLILGQPKIVNTSDDSQRRAALDTAMNTDLVESCMEETGWLFGRTSDQVDYDPGIEPSWGYTKALPKPANMLRLNGIFTDEYMYQPLKRYEDEGDYWYADVDTVYVQYISRSFLTAPQDWPVYFRKYVASALAMAAGPSLPNSNVQNAMLVHKQRQYDAKSNDAIASPPQVICNGNWSQARLRNGPNRGKP